MTPEQLKASILQYAIQGKLVEQRAEEGTGEELYQQIQAEKQRLIKEGKIKKDKPLPDIAEDEKPFDIPESWKWVRIGQIFNLQAGKNITSADIYSEASNGNRYLCYGGNGCRGYVSAFNSEGHYALIGRQGALCGNINVAEGRFYATEHAVVVEHFNKSDVLWCAFFLKALNLNQYATATAQPGLAVANIIKVPIPLPPLAEQKRIVAKIEELLPLVDRYAVAYEKLEQFNAKFPEDMKKSILQYAIQGKLVEQRAEEGTGEELYRQIQEEKKRLIKIGKLKKTRALSTITDEEIPFDFPSSWKVCYIDDIAFVTKLAGFEYTKYIADNLVPDGIPLFKGKNVQNGKLVLSFESYIPESISDELPRSQITKKCLLTPYVGTIGNIAVFDGSFKAHLGSNVGKIELLNSDSQTFVLEEYVLWYLKSTYGYAELTKYKKATAQESISIDAIRNVVIAIPPLEEQHRIVAKLEEILPLCERLK